jgi:hypothetical protein
MRQFYACRFRPADKREYTYHSDLGEPFSPGNEVRVPDKSGEGWSRVYVVAKHPADFVPSTKFDTKPILGIATQEHDARAIATDLTKDEARVLEWLGKEDSSAYGECHGPALDGLIDKRLAMVVAAAGSAGADIGYSRVFLTDRGHAVAKAYGPADLLAVVEAASDAHGEADRAASGLVDRAEAADDDSWNNEHGDRS